MPKHSYGWSSLSPKTIDELSAKLQQHAGGSTPPPSARDHVAVLLLIVGVIGLFIAGCVLPVGFLLFLRHVSGSSSLITLLSMISFWLICAGLFMLFMTQRSARREDYLLLGSLLIATTILLIWYQQQHHVHISQAFLCLFCGTTFWWCYDDVQARIAKGERSLQIVCFILGVGSISSMMLALLLIVPPPLRDAIPFSSIISSNISIALLWLTNVFMTMFLDSRNAARKRVF
jgi:hypothetical protein